MEKFSAQQITEINETIEQIQKAIKPEMEIGARDKKILGSILKGAKVDKKPVYFKTKREFSDAIITHFVKEKGLTRSRFSSNAQPDIFLLGK